MSRVPFDPTTTEVSVTPMKYVVAMGHSQTHAGQTHTAPTHTARTHTAQAHTEPDPLIVLRAAGFDFEIVHEGPGRQCAVCGATGTIAA